MGPPALKRYAGAAWQRPLEMEAVGLRIDRLHGTNLPHLPKLVNPITWGTVWSCRPLGLFVVSARDESPHL